MMNQTMMSKMNTEIAVPVNMLAGVDEYAELMNKLYTFWLQIMRGGLRKSGISCKIRGDSPAMTGVTFHTPKMLR